jgi:hypothetical protein
VVAQPLDARHALGDRLGLVALVGQIDAATERHSAVAGVNVHRLGGQRVVDDEGVQHGRLRPGVAAAAEARPARAQLVLHVGHAGTEYAVRAA